jgi:cysteine synthase
MSKYANILETVGRTPVVKIGKSAPKNVNLYVKIEAFNPLGSVKDRLALGVIEDAEKKGQLKPGQTVVEATSGNTGIGLAMVCAAKGYPLVVTMAESFSIERRKLMRFLGAKVILTPAPEARRAWCERPSRSPRRMAGSTRVNSRMRRTRIITRARRREKSWTTSPASGWTTG